MKIYPLFALILGLGMSIQLPAQIVINEYSASNLNQFEDNNVKFEDWVELYNTSDQPVDIGGWYLSDNPNKPDKWPFPLGTTIGGNDWLRIWCSGREKDLSSQLHASFKITQTKGTEVLTFSNAALELQESIPVEITQLGHSRARVENGAAAWSVCTDPTIANSNNGSDQFKGYAGQPVISLQGGFYANPLMVTVVGTEPNAILYYTTDGTLPTPNSMEVTGQISIDQTTVLKVIAYSNDPEILPSLIDFQTYFINEDFTLPVISVGADELEDLANGDRELRPIGSIEYFEVDGSKSAFSYGELNSHGQDSWALDHRSLDWVSRDEMGYNATVKAKLFKYTDRDDFQRVMMRASGDDNYPAINDFWHQGSTHIRDEYVHTLTREGGLECDVRGVRRMIVFLNGKYWGVYGIRERPADHDYTAHYYDQGKYDLQYLLTWGGTWAEYGGGQAFDEWGELRDFILDRDMSIPENYEIVTDQFNVTSLIDYMIVNLNAVASDWLNYNTGWWRGTNPDGKHKKWGYIIWDLDATFDYYINYSGVPNTDPDAAPCDIDDISDFMDGFFQIEDVGKHEKIFLKLQEENETFRQLYYSRQADLMNGVFSCENMLETLDRMLAVIEPEMPRQIDRWGGSMNEWRSNVQDLKEFIGERCLLLSEGMTDCFDLTGPFQVTLMTEPAEAGEIDFNTYDIEEFPWTGDYFGNMDNLIKAKAFDDDWEFSHWETLNGSSVFPDNQSRKAALRLDGSETLIAHFKERNTSGNNELPQLADFKVYPTVVKEILHIDFQLLESAQVQFSLIDVSGKKVSDFNAEGITYISGAHNLQFNLDDQLASGVYFLRLRMKDGVRTAKVIVGK